MLVVNLNWSSYTVHRCRYDQLRESAVAGLCGCVFTFGLLLHADSFTSSGQSNSYFSYSVVRCTHLEHYIASTLKSK